MKIGLLVDRFPPEKCEGLELATQKIARYLAYRGHEVRVITMLDGGKTRKGTEDGYRVYRYSVPSGYAGYAVTWLKTFLALNKMDAQIHHAQTVIMGVPALFGKILLRKPYVVWCRDDIYPPWRFKRLIAKAVLDNADAAIALTADMKKEMRKYTKKEIYVIPNGVDLSPFRKLNEHGISRAGTLPGRGKIILFVGGLRKIKGVEYLLQAMAIIKQRFAPCTLVLVGDGSERHRLEAQTKELGIEQSVEFVGRAPPERVPDYMRISDVLVLSSTSEGFPNVLLEAMAAGLPIVATRVGGVPDLIKDHVHGFLAEPQSPSDIAQKVITLLEDDELRAKIASENQREAEKYDWDAVVAQLERAYSAALTNGFGCCQL